MVVELPDAAVGAYQLVCDVRHAAQPRGGSYRNSVLEHVCRPAAADGAFLRRPSVTVGDGVELALDSYEADVVAALRPRLRTTWYHTLA